MRFYIQVNNRAFGPFEEIAVKDMISSGGVGRQTPVSTDKVNWTTLGELEVFYPKPTITAPQIDLSKPSSNDERQFSAIQINDPAFDMSVWYVSNDGAMGTGPYSGRQILEMMSQRDASPSSLVWKNGESARKISEDKEFREWMNPTSVPSPSGGFGGGGNNLPPPPVSNEPAEWFYSLDGRSGMGPYTASQVISQVASANASTTALVWRRGENARRFCDEKTFVGAILPSAVCGIDMSPQERDLLDRKIKSRFLWKYICLAISVGAPLVFFILAVIVSAISHGEPTLASEALILLMLGSALVATIAFSCFHLMFLHVFWRTIPVSFARTKPQRAVGFLLIPLFNLYWIFQAFVGGAKDVNAAITAYSSNLIQSGRRPQLAGEGLAMTYCILTLLVGIPIVGVPLIVFDILNALSMKKAALQLTELRSGGATMQQNQSAPVPGGRKVTLDELNNNP